MQSPTPSAISLITLFNFTCIHNDKSLIRDLSSLNSHSRLVNYWLAEEEVLAQISFIWISAGNNGNPITLAAAPEG